MGGRKWQDQEAHRQQNRPTGMGARRDRDRCRRIAPKRPEDLEQIDNFINMTSQIATPAWEEGTTEHYESMRAQICQAAAAAFPREKPDRRQN
eukprot:9500173-Pyramimonas_sp.AAC.2